MVLNQLKEMKATIKKYAPIKKESHDYFILVGDVGATNTTLAIFGIINNQQELLISYHYFSKNISDLVDVVKDVISRVKKFNISFVNACFAVAGPVYENKKSTLTNLPLKIDVKNIITKTEIPNAFLINDFDAISYSINLLKSKDFSLICHKPLPNNDFTTKAVIGAGTGLGKSILTYDRNLGFYVPIASEGGHADFPPQTKEEYGLIKFFQNKLKRKNIIYEDILSGVGIGNVYTYLYKERKFTKTKLREKILHSENKEVLISMYRKKDELCKETFNFFVKSYAKAAKNFALETLSLNGLYIAGGIATKNKEIFKSKLFIKEFESSYPSSIKDVLKNIPVYLITNHNISLYGAAFTSINHQALGIKMSSK